MHITSVLMTLDDLYNEEIVPLRTWLDEEKKKHKPTQKL